MKKSYAHISLIGFVLFAVFGCASIIVENHEHRQDEMACSTEEGNFKHIACDARDSDVGEACRLGKAHLTGSGGMEKSPNIAASYFEKGCMKGSAAACDLWHDAERNSGQGRTPASSSTGW